LVVLHDGQKSSWGGPWPMKAAMESRPSAVSLKVRLHETSQTLTSWWQVRRFRKKKEKKKPKTRVPNPIYEELPSFRVQFQYCSNTPA